MSHRLAHLLWLILLLGGCLVETSFRAVAQEPSEPAATKQSTEKSKKTVEPSQTAEPGEAQSGEAPSADNAQPGEPSSEKKPGEPDSADKAKAGEPGAAEKVPAGEKGAAEKTGANKASDTEKTKAAPPEAPSPKLIEVPQDEPTYTPRPKVTAVFVFTNGDRVESDDYLITKDALFINKGVQKTRYPINTIDRNATKTANEGRGVDIIFPKSKSEFNLDF